MCDEWLQVNYLQGNGGIVEVVRDVKLNSFIYVIAVVSFVVIPRSVSLITYFVGLQRVEARLIKKYKKLYVIVHYYEVRREIHSIVDRVQP